MQKQTENKFDCGLFPIVTRTQQLETAPILIEDEADFWDDDSELYMDDEADNTPTAEFYRAEPLQPWSPYMTYPEQRIIEQKRKDREFWMSLLCFIGDAIIITILFTALFLLS
jgi:hypothetical protein